MRVFDSYCFNIIERASFKDAKPYLEKMLSETGFSYKGIGFDLYDLTGEAGPEALKMLPALEKYSFSYKGYGLMSYKENWRDGEIYADPGDNDDITALFSNVPQKFKFWFGKLVFGGVKWFEDSDDTIAPDYDCKDKFPKKDMPFDLNGISVTFSKDHYKKGTDVCVCIEITNEEQAHRSVKIIEKLVPYLGEPYYHYRRSVFTEEEAKRLKDVKAEERKQLTEFMQNALPVPREPKPWSQPNIMPPPDPKLPHVADSYTLNKAFKGTGFEKEKGQPNWLSVYVCTDEHGFRYEANIQKLTYCIRNEFRIWMVVSGYNFSLKTNDIQYYVVQDGESLEILKKFAEQCENLRKEYGAQLAEKFGDTPAWFNEKPQLFKD